MQRLLLPLVIVEAAVLLWLLMGRGEEPELAGPAAPEAAGEAQPLDSSTSPEPAGSTPKLVGTQGPAGEEPEAPDAAGEESAPPADGATTTVLYGRITDGSGQALSGEVQFAIVSRQAAASRVPVEDGGWYGRGGLAPATYRLRIFAEGYEAYDGYLEIHAGTPALERNFELRPTTQMAVRFVTPAQKPLRDVLGKDLEWLERALAVIATKEKPPARLAPTSDAAHYSFDVGDYRPQALARNAKTQDGRDGTLRVLGGFPVHASVCVGTEILQTRVLSKAVKQLTFVVDPDRLRRSFAGLTFRLTAEGEPSELEELTICLQDATERERHPDAFDRQGDRITIRNHPPGAQMLTVFAGEGLEPWVRAVVLEPGRTLDLGQVHLGRLVRQTVRLLDVDGKPLAGANLMPWDRDAGWGAQRGSPLRFQTDAEGRARLALGARRYGLLVWGPGRVRAAAEVDLRAPVEGDLEIRLPALTPLALQAGAIAPPFGIRIRTEDGGIVAARRFRRRSILPIDIPQGRYTVVITDRNGEERERTLEVEGSEGRTWIIE